VDDDAKVMFTVQLKQGEAPLPKEITLIEEDASGEKARFRWPMVDDGASGDFKAGDGIYTRAVQIKESKSKTMKFRVLLEPNDGGGIQKELTPVEPIQTATLEIKNRPSMLEILSEVWAKIKRGRAKSENGGS
jgi:hypothetical protein